MRRSLLLVVLLLTACVHAPQTHVSDRLYCGLSIPGGGVVSQAELETFIDEVVEPRFPDGFTVWRAKGQWKGGDEEVMVLEFVRPPGRDVSARVDEIAAEYRRRFKQEAVLRVTTPVLMEIE